MQWAGCEYSGTESKKGREKNMRRKQVKEFVEQKERGERVERHADARLYLRSRGSSERTETGS